MVTHADAHKAPAPSSLPQALMGASPAMPAMGARLGSAWLDQVAGSVWTLGLFGEDQGAQEDDDDEAVTHGSSDKPPSRYSSGLLVGGCLCLASALVWISGGLWHAPCPVSGLLGCCLDRRTVWQPGCSLCLGVCLTACTPRVGDLGRIESGSMALHWMP